MKRRIVVYVVAMLLILWTIIFVVDYNRCSNLLMPIFVLPIETYDDGGTGLYYGLGYKVYVKKYISAEYGSQIEKVEMYFFNKVIAAAITDRY